MKLKFILNFTFGSLVYQFGFLDHFEGVFHNFRIMIVRVDLKTLTVSALPKILLLEVEFFAHLDGSIQLFEFDTLKGCPRKELLLIVIQNLLFHNPVV